MSHTKKNTLQKHSKPATKLSSTDHTAWHLYLIPPILLAAITALCYYPSLTYDFQFDDVANITKHFNIRHSTFNQLFKTGSRWIIYWLNSIHYSIGRFNPLSYRIGNVIIHTINGLFSFTIILLALSGLKKDSFFKKYALPLATITSLLFLLHPVQTQTVSYVIQGELEGLAALTILGMTLSFLLFCRIQNKFLKIIPLATLYFFGFFSCGTKEIVIVSPFLILITDWFFVAQGDWADLKKRLWLHASIFLLIFGMYKAWFKDFAQILTFKRTAFNNIGNVITHNPTTPITPSIFFISQFKVILHYLWIFFWPWNISVEYDWMLVKSFFAPDCFFPFVGLLLIGVGMIKLFLKNQASPLLFGLAWFFVSLAPRSTIVPSPELLVDYKTYIGSLGILFFIAIGILKFFIYCTKNFKQLAFLQKPRASFHFATLLLALVCGIATQQRNLVWSSGVNFWANVIKNAPKKARAYNNYGVELSLKQKKYKQAIPYFKKAIQMDKKYPDPCNNLAVCYGHLNRLDDAINALKQGLRINPYYPEGYNNLASFLIQKKNYTAATQMLQTALKLRPYYGKAYFNLARVYNAQNEHEKAWNCLKNACTKADLDNDAGFAAFAHASLQLKKYEEAIWGYEKVLDLNPTHAEAKINLANAYYLAQKYDQAITAFEHCAKTTPHNIHAWYNLGESYSKIGNHEKALNAFKQIPTQNHLFPHLQLRIAQCLTLTGNTKQAEHELNDFIANKNAPSNLQKTAQTMLAQVKKTITT